MEWIKKHKTVVIIGSIALVVVIVALVIINSIFATRNQGEQFEQRMSQLYSSAVNSLSTCLDQGEVAAQVTSEEFDRLKDIMVGVAASRYENESDATEALGGGSAFSAVVENYPSINQDSWQNLQTVVVGCRDEFQGSQDRVLNEARLFNEWRVTDDVFNSWIKAEFPSNELVITTGTGERLYGPAAYDRITRVVAVGEAVTAYETGVLETQELYGNE